MKRFSAATVAAATALTLVAMPAQAAENEKPKGFNHPTSSQVTDEELGLYLVGYGITEALLPGTAASAPFAKSAQDGVFEGSSGDAFLSSFRNDANRGYKIGTTYDILAGTAITAAVLAVLGGGAWAFQQGLIKLPNLPF